MLCSRITPSGRIHSFTFLRCKQFDIKSKGGVCKITSTATAIQRKKSKYSVATGTYSYSIGNLASSMLILCRSFCSSEIDDPRFKCEKRRMYSRSEKSTCIPQ